MRVRYLERPQQKTLAFAPMLCMHCQDAPCLKACPSKAIRRLDDGRVIVDESKCDLEEECVTACPYGAIFINEEKEVAEKCDFCHHRTEVGLEPAWKPEAGTEPSVYYAGHEKWMESMANTGVQLDPKDADIVYEQNNLKKK